MARKPSSLTVVISASARRDQLGIWDYNAETYGVDHADRYLAFLNAETEKLGTGYPLGKPVPGRTGLLYVTFRKGRGAGHVAVFQIRESVIEILRYFHTAQNWQSRLQ